MERGWGRMVFVVWLVSRQIRQRLQRRLRMENIFSWVQFNMAIYGDDDLLYWR